MHGPSPDRYWASSISGASALVKTPVRGDPSTIKVIPAYFAGVNSQAISLTRNRVSPSVPSLTKNWVRARILSPTASCSSFMYFFRGPECYARPRFLRRFS